MAAVLCTSLPIQVNRLEPQLIRPARPTPRETKRLSDIDDQQVLRFHFPVIMSYKNNPPMAEHGKDPVTVIREAVSRALVYYYPLAGRLREGPNKKLLVDCNEEGVLFIEADANVTLQQLGHALQPPSPLLEEFLFNVPGSDGILGCPLFLFQATRLRCGGFVLALRFNHTICDGVGLAQFLNAVGEMARGADSPSIPPVWQRQLLDARDPPRSTCTHLEYEEFVETIPQYPHPNLIQKSFYFGPKEMNAIRKQLPTHLSTSSRFELITALVWKCRTLSLGLNPAKIVRFSCAVNARGKRNNLGLPLGYYGNAFAFPAVVSTAELLRRNPLGYAVELVKESKAKMDEEYMRSLADFHAIRGQPRLTMSSGTDFIASDNTRTGVGDVLDFGWGRPTFGGVARSTDMISGYARDNNYEEDYGILVPICLPFSCMERFEEELKRMVMTLEPVENRYKK